MFKEEIRHSSHEPKTILLLAECWGGAISASRFAAQMLFDKQSHIILLNTYQQHRSGVSMMRSITPILKKTAKEDLEILKNTLVSEYGIPENNITEKIYEGDIISVINSEYSQHKNLSIVLGQNLNNPLRQGFCRKVINYLLSSQIRPVFLISNIITLIESSRIILFAEKEESISNLYTNYLRDKFAGDYKQLDIVTHNNIPNIKMDQSTEQLFSKQIKHRKHSMNTCEYLLYDLIENSDRDQ